MASRPHAPAAGAEGHLDPVSLGMDASAPTIYRPRRPQETPLYRLVQDQFETLVQVHEERFQRRCGRLRHAARRAVEKFPDCGVLELGFARVRCNRCRAEFLVAFSCKVRIPDLLT